MEETCKEHGLTKFHSEPFTDVKTIREKTNIICMNFGTGYYGAHSSTEYCVIEDMDNACRMGHALIEKIGNTEHKLEHKGSYTWVKTANGGYTRPAEKDEEEEFFRKLSGVTTTYGGGNYSYGGRNWDEYEDYWGDDCYGHYSGATRQTTQSTKQTTTTTQSTSSTTTTEAKKDNVVDVETLHYISEKYEQYVDDIKDNVKKKCEELGINFDEFAFIFKNEIKF